MLKDITTLQPGDIGRLQDNMVNPKMAGKRFLKTYRGDAVCLDPPFRGADWQEDGKTQVFVDVEARASDTQSGSIVVLDVSNAENFKVEYAKTFPRTSTGQKHAEELFTNWIKGIDPGVDPDQLKEALRERIHTFGEGYIALVFAD